MKRSLGLLCCCMLLASCAFFQQGEGPSATAMLRPASGSKVNGSVTFTQVGERVRIKGEVTGHTPGPKGFHIHEKGDCSDPNAMSTGGHFNPQSRKHGAPGSAERHAGDLGNLMFDASGNATINMTVDGLSVSRSRPDGIVGRGLIVHAQQDDLKTDPTGNAGGRLACAVIN